MCPLHLEVKTLFNPDKIETWFFLPGVVGILIMQVALILTSTTVVRERENNTLMSKRFRNLADQLGTNLQIAEGLSEGPLSFSREVLHGVLNSNMGTLMMTRIEMDNRVFVHASDIQLLDDSTVDRVINWQPDIVLAAGPPLYLDQLSKVERECAWHNALRLASNIDVVILDYHLMRSVEGEVWLDKLSAAVGKKVYCAADFMGRPRQLLEAKRAQLYNKMPVPDGWHDDYAKGLVDTDEYSDVIRYQDMHGVNTSHHNDGDGH